MGKFTIDNSDLPTEDISIYISREESDQMYSDILSQKHEEAEESARREHKHKIRVEAAIRARTAKGLKTNKITANELQELIEHWIENDYTPLSRSYRFIYNNTDNTYKEEDWVEKMPNSLYYGKELIKAIESSTCNKLVKLRESYSWVSDKKMLLRRERLTKRILEMKKMLSSIELLELKEEELLETKEENERLKAALLAKETWKDTATRLLKSGMKQKDVAAEVGKSLPSIKALSSRIKKEGKL